MLQRWQHMALALRCCSCLLVLQEHLAACSRLPSRSAIMFLLHGVVLVDPTAQTTTSRPNFFDEQHSAVAVARHISFLQS